MRSAINKLKAMFSALLEALDDEYGL